MDDSGNPSSWKTKKRVAYIVCIIMAVDHIGTQGAREVLHYIRRAPQMSFFSILFSQI